MQADVDDIKTEFIELGYSMQSELLRFFRRKLSNKHDAEDSLQELFIIVNKLDESIIEKIEDSRCYIFRIAHNLVIALFKKRLKEARINSELRNINDITYTASSPEVIVEVRQKVELLKEAIASMPQKRRDIFLLYRFGKMTQVQIAEEIGISTKGVEKHIARALEHCRDWLKHRGG